MFLLKYVWAAAADHGVGRARNLQRLGGGERGRIDRAGQLALGMHDAADVDGEAGHHERG